jgi:hypothetical protein
MPRLASISTVIFLSASAACANPVEPDPGSLLGTVRLLTVEGGCWVIDASDGVRYEPVSLPTEFRQDGLRVSVALHERPDIGSFCMVGRMAEILSIQSR